MLVALLLFWLAVKLVKEPADFIEVGLIGLTTGCLYALIALGYTLVYGILELIRVIEAYVGAAAVADIEKQTGCATTSRCARRTSARRLGSCR